MSALALQIDQYEFTDTIGDAIRRAMLREGVKGIARAANANLRTVENWARKRSTPDGLHLARLVATIPEVASEFRRLAAMESDLDPEFDREFSQLVTRYQRMKAQ